MNVYDEAHSLARAIRESNEFKEFDRMRVQVESDPDVSKMLGEMQQLQVALQAAQMQGQQPDPETMKRVQSLGTMLATKPLAARFMQTEAAFSLMMNDVFAIIGEAMGMK